MKRTLLTIALLAIIASGAAGIASAQGEDVSLKGLAKRVATLEQRISGFLAILTEHDRRIEALETHEYRNAPHASIEQRLEILEKFATPVDVSSVRGWAEQLLRDDYAYEGVSWDSLPADLREEKITGVAFRLIRAAWNCEFESVNQGGYTVQAAAVQLQSEGVTGKSLGHANDESRFREKFLIFISFHDSDKMSCSVFVNDLAARWLVDHWESQE